MARTDVKEITKRLEQGVKEVFESDKYKEYLTFMSKFTDYSFNNTMLIMLQCPHASLVAGYKAWSTKFKRQVRKGEKAIKILAPCTHKKTIEKDGEEKEVAWTSFRAVNVFDISQTDGQEIPTACVENLIGDVDGYEALLKKLEGVSPVPVEYQNIDGGANGFYSRTEERIAVQIGMSNLQTIKTLIHEISHAMLHGKGKEEGKADRLTREVQAESVAYTVCSVLGLDTSDYSFGYIAGWSSGKELKELSASMDVICKTSKALIEKVKKF